MSSMNIKQINLLKEHLQPVYNHFSPVTQRLYRNWIIRLVKFTEQESGNLVPLRHITQSHCEAFIAHLVRPGNCTRSTTNQVARAINLYFEHIDKDIHLETLSTQHKGRRIERISPGQVQSVLDNLNVFYREIAERIYYDLQSPTVACSQTKSMGNNTTTVHPSTLNAKIRKAAEHIPKIVTAKTLQQSGIIHRLEDGQEWRKVGKMAGLAESTMKRTYILNLLPYLSRKIIF